jgi:CubicO group peptidase (beta-lactamase class C family)
MDSPPEWSGAVRVTRRDEVVAEACSGMSNRAAGDLCDAVTRFQAGSVSKQFVAAAAMLLVERNELALHAPIRRWLPQLTPAWREITPHQLLTHTSGLGHWNNLAGVKIESALTEDELVNLAARSPLMSPPGQRFRYSGLGYVLAARLVAAAAAAPYDAFAREQLLARAGLHETTSGLCPVGQPGVAYGYHTSAEVEVNPHLSRLFGTGDLWTTVGDLSLWSASLHAATLLNTSSVTTMMTRHVPVPAPEAGAAHPIITTGYGYGTRVGTVLGHAALLHTGDNPGYSSLVAWLPSTATTVVVLTNDDGRDLAEPLNQIVFPVL